MCAGGAQRATAKTGLHLYLDITLTLGRVNASPPKSQDLHTSLCSFANMCH